MRLRTQWTSSMTVWRFQCILDLAFKGNTQFFFTEKDARYVEFVEIQYLVPFPNLLRVHKHSVGEANSQVHTAYKYSSFIRYAGTILLNGPLSSFHTIILPLCELCRVSFFLFERTSHFENIMIQLLLYCT